MEEGVHEGGKCVAAQIWWMDISISCRSFVARSGNSILVFTRIGPLFSGREISASRVVNSNLTCEVFGVGDDRSPASEATGSEAMLVVMMMLLILTMRMMRVHNSCLDLGITVKFLFKFPFSLRWIFAVLA